MVIKKKFCGQIDGENSTHAFRFEYLVFDGWHVKTQKKIFTTQNQFLLLFLPSFHPIFSVFFYCKHGAQSIHYKQKEAAI